MLFIDIDILLVTHADVGKVGRPVARLVGHDPLSQPQGGRGGGAVGGPDGVSGPSGDGAIPLGEGNSSAIAEVVAERAHSDVAEVRIAVLMA